MSRHANGTFEQACRNIALEIAALVIEKQKDYGPDNVMMFKEKGRVVRLWDKMSRLKTLVWGEREPKYETIEDSFKDTAGYAIIALMLANDTFLYELKETAYVTKKEKSNGKS